MLRLVYLLIFILFFEGFFSLRVVRYFSLIPELFSIGLFALIVLKVGIDKKISLHPKYMILALLVILHVVVGLILNGVQPGTIAIGSRPYLKWLPLFFLPAIYHFSEEELRKILRLILVLCLIQLPVAFFQKLVEFSHMRTGDVITGTLNFGMSGALSILLLSVIAVLTSFYARHKIGFGRYAVLVILLFLPTTINETKVTIVLLPFALFLPFLFSGQFHLLDKRMLMHVGMGVVLVAVYAVIYNFYQVEDRPDITEFVEREHMQAYMFGRSELIQKSDTVSAEFDRVVGDMPEQIGEEWTPRFTKMAITLKALSGDPIVMWTGVGIGNVSDSIVDDFMGQYSRRFGNISRGITFTIMLWETGLGGVLLLLIFVLFMARDTYHFISERGTRGAFAGGFMAIHMMFLLMTIYINMFYAMVLIYLYILFGGFFAAERYREGRLRQEGSFEESGLAGRAG